MPLPPISDCREKIRPSSNSEFHYILPPLLGIRHIPRHASPRQTCATFHCSTSQHAHAHAHPRRRHAESPTIPAFRDQRALRGSPFAPVRPHLPCKLYLAIFHLAPVDPWACKLVQNPASRSSPKLHPRCRVTPSGVWQASCVGIYIYLCMYKVIIAPIDAFQLLLSNAESEGTEGLRDTALTILCSKPSQLPVDYQPVLGSWPGSSACRRKRLGLLPAPCSFSRSEDPTS